MKNKWITLQRLALCFLLIGLYFDKTTQIIALLLGVFLFFVGVILE